VSDVPLTDLDAPPPARTTFTRGLGAENPVLVQALGMCPTLAVTNSAVNALAMGLATSLVLLVAATVVSAGRRLVPAQVRIASWVLVIATLVTCVDYALQALALELHAELGAFVSLIVVNCLILGRMEAFASRQPVPLAVADALGMGAGFTGALLLLGVLREVLGSGTLFGIAVLPASFQPWTVMLLPPGGFFALAAVVLGRAMLPARRTDAPEPAR
jgi:electron transport complex protein RnfE